MRGIIKLIIDIFKKKPNLFWDWWKNKSKVKVPSSNKFYPVDSKQKILLETVGTKTNCCLSSGTGMLGNAQGKEAT